MLLRLDRYSTSTEYRIVSQHSGLKVRSLYENYLKFTNLFDVNKNSESIGDLKKFYFSQIKNVFSLRIIFPSPKHEKKSYHQIMTFFMYLLTKCDF